MRRRILVDIYGGSLRTCRCVLKKKKKGTYAQGRLKGWNKSERSPCSYCKKKKKDCTKKKKWTVPLKKVLNKHINIPLL